MSDLDARKALIQRMFGAANKTCDEGRMDGYLEALKLMDTPRLVRVTERVLAGISELTDPEDYRPPAAGALWKLHRKMRALPSPPLVLHGAPAQKFDDWDTAANSHLLNYVTLGLVQQTIHGQKPTRHASRYAPDSRYDGQKRCVIPGPMTRAITEVLQRWKNAWATDMREDRELYDGKRDGKALWVEYMASAEAEIDKLARAAA